MFWSGVQYTKAVNMIRHTGPLQSSCCQHLATSDITSFIMTFKCHSRAHKTISLCLLASLQHKLLVLSTWSSFLVKSLQAMVTTNHLISLLSCSWQSWPALWQLLPGLHGVGFLVTERSSDGRKKTGASSEGDEEGTTHGYGVSLTAFPSLCFWGIATLRLPKRCFVHH